MTTNVHGIFQSDLIVRSALIIGLKELRDNPNLIRDALGGVPQDTETAGRYGEKTVDQCVEWFLTQTIPVKVGLALTQLTSTCISLELSGGDEADSTIGDQDYNIEEVDPWEPTQGRHLESVHCRENINVVLLVQNEPEYLLFLDALVRFVFLRRKEDLLDARGFSRVTFGVGPASRLGEVSGRENFYTRTIRLSGVVRHVWPRYNSGPTTMIESVPFGGMIARAVSNSAGDGVSVSVAPSAPTPAPHNPFDAEDWMERDMLTGLR